ncbi:MAG: hypothetical protein SNJ69_10235, partial [Chloroflexaceae bacterium]
MLSPLLALTIIIVQTALVTLVAVRSRGEVASRLFISFCIAVILMIGGVLLRDAARTPEEAYVSLGLATTMLGYYLALMLLLFSALFVPQWWEGPALLRRPIFWISLPYFLTSTVLGLDIAGRLGFVVEGVRLDDIYRLTYVRSTAIVFVLLAAVGHVVLLTLLGFAFFDRRHRHIRSAIALLFLPLLFSVVLGALTPRLGQISNVLTQIQILPMVATLSY